MYALTLSLIVCLSIVNAQNTINVFYPSDLSEATCSFFETWTMWFNTASPSNRSGDYENVTTIIAQYPKYICLAPNGVQAQSVNYRGENIAYEWRWTLTARIVQIISFYSTMVNVDFRVRYCCPTGTFSTPASTSTSSTSTSTTVSTNASTCGKQDIAPKTNSTSRIYGGTQVIPYSWPWMVYVQQKFPCNNTISGFCSTVCGGTLISKDYVMTAAHCTNSTNPSNITIVAGMFNRSSTTETDTRQIRTATEVNIHPEYDLSTVVNDITVIRVSPSFTFTKYVQPACLPGPEPQPNDQVIILGWGAQKVGGPVSDVLKQASTRIVGNCTTYWSHVNPAKQLCVANPVSGDSSCPGDSGGPIVALNNGRYIASGVASYIQNCNTLPSNYSPNVYTRVAAYSKWIYSITGLL